LRYGTPATSAARASDDGNFAGKFHAARGYFVSPATYTALYPLTLASVPITFTIWPM
jgi:hypothetical protein